ncbi:MAG TPA: adenylate/guanylate cyclase domain-containing protein [Candidatus Binatus sp.]|nr:adenylate/guanylate cyclase domain-containing protein [Candidatus Binatus sp.]
MRCATCGTDLIAGKKFCHACGARAALECPGCGASVTAEFRFCPDCGRDLASGAVHDVPPPVQDPLERLSRTIPEGLAQKIRAAQPAMEGERKQVTVLFCDLVGSTAIAEGLDPEEYGDLLDEYLALGFREIYAFEGIVNQLAGDGMMALFGAPVAHEDAPQRAVRAALAIRHALSGLNERRPPAFQLRVRIGIHTGPVVVGTIGNDLKMDYTAIGDTTNLASRLETLAAPGTILISEATHRLVRGFFRVRTTGPLLVRGKSEPVTAYEVLGESAGATPMAIAAERGLTPLVGREEELAQLDACFRRLEGNLAQVVAVVGDAGLGKSRLLYEFKQRLDGEEVMFFEGRCASLGQAVPYYPFINMLKHYFGLLPGDSVAAACAKVADTLGHDSTERAEIEYPALSRMLGLLVETRGEPAPDELKRETFDAVTRLLLAESHEAPVVVTLEDLHWIDDASRELLENIVARLASVRVMVLVTHRPEDRAAWRTRAALTQLVLRRLSDDDIREVLRAVAGGPLPEQLEVLLVAKAEGSPFWAEEITRSLIEEGYLAQNGGGRKLTRPLEEIRIPGTVQEVIAARLDRLGPQAKRVAQVAAALGRQFRSNQLGELLRPEGIDVHRELAELEQRGILHRKSVLTSDEYRFGESLTQEVAYEGLLLKQRRQLHERIGTLLEAEPGDGGADRSALLAHHFARSDNRRRAIEALLRAGADAESLPSYRTAVDFYRRAWQLLDAEPDDERSRRDALTATGALARIGVVFGWPPLEEAERAARRGRELAEALGDTEALAGLLYFHGVTVMLAGRDDFARGMVLAEQAVALADRAGLKLTVLRLSRGLAINHALDGRFDLAQRAMDWVMSELEPSGDRERLTDLYVSARWLRDNVLLMSDQLDEVFASASETHAMALRAPNRTVTAGSANILAQVHFLRGDYAEALRWADESVALSEAIGNVSGFTAPAAVALASRAELGEPLEADRYLELIDLSFGAGGTVQSNFRFIADGLLAAGDLERAERLVERLRAHPSRSGRLREAYMAAAVGQLTLRLGRHDEAERAFAEAIAIADLIGARSTLAAATLGAAELAAARGDSRTSARHLERALAISRTMRLGRYLRRAERLLGADAAAATGQA